MNTGIKKSAKKILLIISIVLLIGVLFSDFGGIGGSGAKESAEKSVKQIVYTNWGIIPTDLKSSVIYKSGKERLIEVRFKLDSNDWAGSCCVYTNGDITAGSTKLMSADYDFEEHIEECKALFALS